MDAYGRRKLVAGIILFALLVIGLIGEAMQDRTLRNRALGFLAMACAGLVALVALVVLVWALVATAHAHDRNRPDLDGWFMSLRNGRDTPCCDGADAKRLDDVEWEAKDGHYRVLLSGHWVDVPDDAVVKGPNRDGPAMVWPFYLNGELIGVRCFMPGAGT